MSYYMYYEEKCENAREFNCQYQFNIMRTVTQVVLISKLQDCDIYMYVLCTCML